MHPKTKQALNKRGVLDGSGVNEDWEPRLNGAKGFRNEHGLTPRQENFARLVSEGKTLADAYRGSYNTEKLAPKTLWIHASKLMDHEGVAKRVRGLVEEKEKRFGERDAYQIRRYVFGRLMEESSDKGSSASARIRALELLGKMDVVGMFKDKEEETASPKRDIKALEDELRSKLERFLASQPIDVTPISSQ